MEEMTAGQLVAAHLRGDEKAFAELVNRHLKAVYRFVCRQIGPGPEAEDITQETFVKVWKNLKKYDTSRNFLTWILVIARNTTLDYLKKKRNIPFSDFDDAEGNNAIADNLADPAPLPAELLDRAGLAQTALSALALLPEKQRMVLYLHYNDHLTFDEIGEILGEPLQTVKSRHRRAIVALRARLIGDGFGS